MKELTIEEKAKAYDEVLKQIKECTPDENGFVTIYPNEIFPELAEGDDERIRKEIISYLKRRLKFDSSIPAAIGYWIAWLEKQGEQIDIANKEYWRGYREGKQEVLDKYTELEKQGEQKPANWLQELEDKLANATPQQLAEWKEKYFREESTWSEENKKMMLNIIDDIHCGTNFNPKVMHAANEREREVV